MDCRRVAIDAKIGRRGKKECGADPQQVCVSRRAAISALGHRLAPHSARGGGSRSESGRASRRGKAFLPLCFSASDPDMRACVRGKRGHCARVPHPGQPGGRRAMTVCVCRVRWQADTRTPVKGGQLGGQARRSGPAGLAQISLTQRDGQRGKSTMAPPRRTRWRRAR
jgi:hypothetical protein